MTPVRTIAVFPDGDGVRAYGINVAAGTARILTRRDGEDWDYSVLLPVRYRYRYDAARAFCRVFRDFPQFITYRPVAGVMETIRCNERT